MAREVTALGELRLWPEFPPSIGRLVLVCAAGFEERATRTSELVSQCTLDFAGAVVLRFSESAQAENEANCQMIVGRLSTKIPLDRIVAAEIGSTEEVLTLARSVGADAIVVDISGMPHGIIMRLLAKCARSHLRLIVSYTEALTYYPKKAEADKYLKYEDDDSAFIAACQQEDSEVMFAGEILRSLTLGRSIGFSFLHRTP